jgi:aldehyde dehydrogenase (NAD+)
MVQFANDSTSQTLDGISDRIHQLVQNQRSFFNTGKTKDVEFRLAQLKKLRQAIKDFEAPILEALKADLHKPEYEAFLTEIGVLQEVDYAIKHLRSWVKPQKVSVPLTQMPGKARVYAEPLGVVLIVAPWNYPLQLAISPLVGAIGAGNCALIKPSEVAPHTSKVIAQLIEKTFDPAYIAVVEGGIEVSQAVLEEKFDHIFFTGGTAIGKIVMQAAAKQLTPVTLELGGKSPCIVDQNTNLETTAKRITWGKFLNAGQTCIAPDYLLVDRRLKPALIDAIRDNLREFYGEDPAQSPDYARIVNHKHCSRLINLIDHQKVIIGGETNLDDRYIAPTVMDHVNWNDPIMQDEIFGPILPILEYNQIEEAIEQINCRPKPLALYLFTHNKQLQQQVLHNTSSGGVCINDTIMQIGVHGLPFGGVGDSGIGNYHGKASFDTFSHQKSVFFKPFWLDFAIRYAPYQGKFEKVKKLLG